MSDELGEPLAAPEGDEPLSEPAAARADAATRQLRVVRVLYFLQGFSASSFGRFATLFYIDRGLTPHMIGLVEAVQPLTGVVGNQFFAAIADIYHCKKRVQLFAMVVSTCCLCSLALPFVSCCFERILGAMAVMQFFSVSAGVLDAYTLDLLGEARRREYGAYRLWTAVSWGVGNAIMGFVAEHGFAYNFALYGGLSALNIAMVAIALPARTRDEQRRVDERRVRAGRDGVRVPHWRAWRRADGSVQAEAAPDAPGGEQEPPQRGGGGTGGSCARACSARMLSFWLLMVAIGCGFTVVEKFLFVFAEKELGATPSLCGLSVSVTVIFELPIFLYADALLTRLGHDLMVGLAVLAYAARVYGYTTLGASTVWWLLALEPLHGVTFSLAWVAAVDKVNAEFPDRWKTTGQLLLATCMWYIGRLLGALTGGAIFSAYGGRALYRFAAAAAAAVLAAHLLASAALRLCGRRALLAPPPVEDEAALLRPLDAAAVPHSCLADAGGTRGEAGGDVVVD